MRYFFIAILFAMSFVSGGAFASGTSTSTFYDENALDGRGTYNFAVMANHSLEVRVRELRETALLTQAIREACDKGVRVSVLLYIGGRNTAPVLANTCAEIYLSRYRELDQGDVGLLLDREFLVVNGRPIAARNSLAMEELEFMRHQRRTSDRIQ
jgi:hypothetical protein